MKRDEILFSGPRTGDLLVNFLFGLSSISSIKGQLFGSIEAAASLDFSSLIILCMERTMPLLETSTIMRTVGSVVIRFCG